MNNSVFPKMSSYELEEYFLSAPYYVSYNDDNEVEVHERGSEIYVRFRQGEYLKTSYVVNVLSAESAGSIIWKVLTWLRTRRTDLI